PAAATAAAPTAAGATKPTSRGGLTPPSRRTHYPPGSDTAPDSGGFFLCRGRGRAAFAPAADGPSRENPKKKEKRQGIHAQQSGPAPSAGEGRGERKTSGIRATSEGFPYCPGAPLRVARKASPLHPWGLPLTGHLRCDTLHVRITRIPDQG